MEYWDIYDSRKLPTGRIMKRNDWILKDGEYHLSVLGVIHRPDGKILITRRIETKDWAPGWWEVPGGGVRAGEKSKDAAVREIREETGLDVSHAQGGLAKTYHRENPGKGDNYFVDVYSFELDFDISQIVLQKEETTAFQLADLSMIRELDRRGIFLHYSSIREVLEAAGKGQE